MSKKPKLIPYAGAPDPAGRKKKYETPKAFDAAVDKYVKQCNKDGRPLTWTGMALALGFTSRIAIDNYSKYEGFEASVERARLFVENSYENRLFGQSPTGAIFALKNMGWSDKQEMEHTSPDGSMTPQPVKVVLAAPDDYS